ncbi:hypothetical protein AWV80_23780 [Cupriavidus sp. UYMU48A]|nr:hypothetical protein AWV80_23780 [Cupriavidus sp. UYMU48A]
MMDFKKLAARIWSRLLVIQAACGEASGIGGQMNDEGYKPWRRRWLRLHSRSLLANALMLAEVELDAYLKDKRTAYRDYGDFTENEIDFISTSVPRHPTAAGASHLA